MTENAELVRSARTAPLNHRCKSVSLRVPVIIVLVLAGLISGCDTLNWQQYRVSDIHANSADADRLKGIVMTVARRHALKDATQSFPVPGPLIFVTEPDVAQFHTDIGVWLFNDDALVDVTAGFGPRVRKFERVSAALGRALAAEFGTRLVVVSPQQRASPAELRLKTLPEQTRDR